MNDDEFKSGGDNQPGIHGPSGISLGFLLVDVSRLFRSSFDKAIEHAGLNLTPGEARTLVHLADIGRCNQSTLANNMSIEPMSVSSYLDRLVLRNFVVRVSDPTDRRSKVVYLTAAGKTVLQQIEPIIDSVYMLAVSGINPNRMNITYYSLNNLRDNLIAICKK